MSGDPTEHAPLVKRRTPLAAAVLLVGIAVGGVTSVAWTRPAAAQSGPGISITPSPAPAFAADAPDPDIVRDGSTYYAFTTGTVLGNSLQALVDTSGSPLSGWRSYTGSYGSTALADVPGWEEPNTQNAPGTFFWGGRWIMYYTAALAGHADDTGHNCISVATAASLTPSDPVFTDDSTGPLLCQPRFGGAIDPSPFIDPATGSAYLVWKSNDGGSRQPARFWSQRLSSSGLSLVGSPTEIMTQDGARFPWETTIENPDMVETQGTTYLVFSVGTWDTPSYSEAATICARPTGPCSQATSSRILTSSGSASGPGGGSLFQDASGRWYLGYAAWKPGCTSYSCGGSRRLFVAPATLTPISLTGMVTGMAALPDGSGYWLVNAQGGVSAHGTAILFGSMAGRPLNSPIRHIVSTPDGRGYWLVAGDGGTFAFGNAGFYGSMGSHRLNAPVVDMAPTPDGKGYWLVASDGGIFAFGDARFHGSMGGIHLNKPVVGIAADARTGGYWEVATDGGIFAFGAPFHGSTGNLVLNRPVNGMAVTPGDGGYWFVASDGGIFAFGDAPFRGSAGRLRLAAPIVAMAADSATDGYWLVGTDGGVFAFGAPYLGSD